MLMVRATPADLVALLEARGELTLGSARYGQLLGQVALSEAYALYRCEKSAAPVALAGIAPLGSGAGELWFSCGALSGGVLAALVRRARDVLRCRRDVYPRGVICLVDPGYLPGERLARLCGFRPADNMVRGRREWVWR